jgi:putative methyltransferase (TIGR04325 family)
MKKSNKDAPPSTKEKIFDGFPDFPNPVQEPVIYDVSAPITEPGYHKHVRFYGAWANYNPSGHFSSGAYPKRAAPDHVPVPREDSDPRGCAYADLINNIAKDKLNIIDFGGADGVDYLTLKKKTIKKFDYRIVEIPQEWRNDVSKEIKYYKSLEEASATLPDKEEFDLVYSNGTIYLFGLHMKLLSRICKIGSPRILLQRMIISVGGNFEHFYTYEPRTQAHYSIRSEESLISAFADWGYKLSGDKPFYKGVNFAHLPDPACSCLLPPDVGTICYRDFLFVKKELT